MWNAKCFIVSAVSFYCITFFWYHHHPIQIAAYVVDYDINEPSHMGLPGRQSTVALLSRATLNAAAPVQFLPKEQTTGGVWLVFQYNSSARLRFSQLIGDNAVVSALAFDTVD